MRGGVSASFLYEEELKSAEDYDSAWRGGT